MQIMAGAKFQLLAILSLMMPVYATVSKPAYAATSPKTPQSASPAKPADRVHDLGTKALNILKTAMKHDDSDVRALVAQQWGEIGSPAIQEKLREQLDDSNSYVRIAAAKSLYQLGDKKSGLTVLLNIIKKRPKNKGNEENMSAIEEMKEIAHDKVRVAALKALAQMETSQGVEKVLKWAEKDPRGAIRDAAAIELARLGHDEEIDRFVTALNSEDENERLAGIWSLGEIATRSVVEPLKAKLQDPSYHVRAAVMQALGAVSDSGSLADLEAGTHDANDMVRAKAVEGLSKMRSQEAVPYLKYVVEQSTNAYLQLLAMNALAGMNNTVDLHLAQRSLSQPDFDTRMLGVEVLEGVGGSQALDILEVALEDSQMKVRVRAAAAIIKLLKKLRH